MKELLHYKIYHVEGAPWMVFVHGAGGSMRTWHKQISYFKDRFNLLLIDLRDHGESKNIKKEQPFDFEEIATDVLEVMDELQIREAHFVGVSMGSIIIREIESLAPERMSSIILAGGIFKMSMKINLLSYLARGLTLVLPFQTLYQLFALVLLPKENHLASRRMFIREAKKLQNAEARKWLTLVRKLDRNLKKTFARNISVPCLIVMGSEDHVFLTPARQFAERYQGVILEIIDRCGHVCNIEKAAEFNRYCLDFIQSLEQKSLPQQS